MITVRPWKKEEIDFLKRNYTILGPSALIDILGRNKSSITHKAYRLGLEYGIVNSNKRRKNSWNFSGWSYELGYIAGVYVGDGDLYSKQNNGARFRLSVIDQDFALTVKNMLYTVTGYNANMSYRQKKSTNYYETTLCNVDFCNWLVNYFGPANYKSMFYIDDPLASMGFIEGIADSEGAFQGKSIIIRMCMNLKPLETMCNIIHGFKFRSHHKGAHTIGEWGTDSFGRKMNSFSISKNEYNRLGFGTYIQRKSNGLLYKFC